jgi:ribosome maturation factor RimP
VELRNGLSDPVGEITRMIEPSLSAMGYDLVRVQIAGGQHRPTLQIMAERIDGAAMTVEHCAEISRAVSALLDVADPLQGAYVLEASSPGIDRPLVKPRDYERFLGHEARVETRWPIGGRKKFRGRLKAVNPEAVRVAAPEGEVEIPFAEIERAKLVLTDELIAESLRRGKHGQQDVDQGRVN